MATRREWQRIVAMTCFFCSMDMAITWRIKQMEMHSLLQECRLNPCKGKKRHPAALSMSFTSAKCRGICRLLLPPLYLQGASCAWWPVAGPRWVTSEHSELSRVGIASLTIRVFSCIFPSSCFNLFIFLSKSLFLGFFYTFLLLTTLKFIFSFSCASFKIPPNSTTFQIDISNWQNIDYRISFFSKLIYRKIEERKISKLAVSSFKKFQ